MAFKRVFQVVFLGNDVAVISEPERKNLVSAARVPLRPVLNELPRALLGPRGVARRWSAGCRASRASAP